MCVLCAPKKGGVVSDFGLSGVKPSVRVVFGFMEWGKSYGFMDIVNGSGLSKPVVSSALKVLVGRKMVRYDIDNRVYEMI